MQEDENSVGGLFPPNWVESESLSFCQSYVDAKQPEQNTKIFAAFLSADR